MATSYTNRGGSGDRRTVLAVTSTITAGAGGVTYLLDGSQLNNYYWTTGQSGREILFDFGAGVAAIIDEFTFYQDSAHTQGTWTFRASDDNSTWTNLATGINLGDAATDVNAFSNSTGYRYYSLLQTAGSTTNTPWVREIEFKIDGMPATVTWNPSDKSANITLSAANACATGTNTSDGLVRSTTSHNSGKWYFEFSAESMTSLAVGIATAAATAAGVQANGALAAVVFGSKNLWVNTSNLGAAITSNSTPIGCAVDLDASLIWFWNGGNWNNSGTANPATGAGGKDISGFQTPGSTDIFIALDVSSPPDSAVLTAGNGIFNYAPPSGFNAWSMSADTGTWASTEATDTFDGAGAKGHTGTWASTEAVDTFTGAGKRGHTGTWASSEATDVVSGAGYLGIAGAWDSTEAPDILDATGVLETFGGIVGSFDTSEPPDVFAAEGSAVIIATMAVREEPDIFNAFGKITIIGTFTPTEARDVFSGAAHVTGETGTWASNEPVDRMTATGKVPRVGTWASTEHSDTALFTGLGFTGTTARRIFFVT